MHQNERIVILNRDKIIALAREKFRLDPDGAHGWRHWEQVEANGLALWRTAGANVNVVQHFAWLHDACREDDFDDPKHSLRAADWAELLFDDGLLPLTVDEHFLLVQAIRGHNMGMISTDPTIGTCWDADRLDLWRVGVVPADRFLSTAAAKDLLNWKIKNKEFL